MAGSDDEADLNVFLLHQKWKTDPLHSKRQKAHRNFANVSSPPAYVANFSGPAESDSSTAAKQLAAKRTWEVAMAPLKQIPMNMFIMYMAGNSMSLFPIMMVGMMLCQPIKALISINSAFRGIEKESLISEKLVFIVGNVISLMLALYKCSSMGILPTHQSDWLAFAESPERMEFSVGGFSF